MGGEGGDGCLKRKSTKTTSGLAAVKTTRTGKCVSIHATDPKVPILTEYGQWIFPPINLFLFCRTLPLEYKAGTIFWWHIYIYCISVNIWMCSLGQEISHKNISSVFLRNHHFLAVFDRLFSLLNCIFYKQKLLNLDFLSEKPHQLIYIVAVVTGTIPPLCVRTTKKIFLLKSAVLYFKKYGTISKN